VRRQTSNFQAEGKTGIGEKRLPIRCLSLKGGSKFEEVSRGALGGRGGGAPNYSGEEGKSGRKGNWKAMKEKGNSDFPLSISNAERGGNENLTQGWTTRHRTYGWFGGERARGRGGRTGVEKQFLRGPENKGKGTSIGGRGAPTATVPITGGGGRRTWPEWREGGDPRAKTQEVGKTTSA